MPAQSQRGGRGRGMAPIHLQPQHKQGEAGQHHALAAFTFREKAVPTAQEARWALKQVWMGTENLAAIGIQSPDRPAHSYLLYQLCSQ